MVKIFASGAVVQPEALHKAAREVKRRGTRLRSMLALTEEISTRELPVAPRRPIRGAQRRRSDGGRSTSAGPVLALVL
jgi:hypothetical protein